jgi:hypothetical protein
MGQRIDDLEKNIADLMTQAGVDEKWCKLYVTIWTRFNVCFKCARNVGNMWRVCENRCL